MTDAIGKTIVIGAMFMCGMATTILLEKIQVLPMTCQVDGEVYAAMGGR